MMLKITAALAALVATVSCAARATGKGPLPAPNAAAVTPSSYQPERPFALQNDGALTRSVYRTEGGTAYRAEVRDLLLPPGKTTSLALEGAAIVDVREGTGAAAVQGRDIQLSAGTTFGLSQGQTARVQNSGTTPLALRIYVVAVP